MVGHGRKPGFHHSQESKDKIRKKAKNRIISKETRDKMSISNKGRTPWNKGKKGLYHHSEETLQIMRSKSHKPTPQAIEAARLWRINNRGSEVMKHTKESKEKLRKTNKGKIPYAAIEAAKQLDKHGKNNSNWKGGSSYEPYCPKFNERFKERVRAFFGYTCVICGHKWHKGEKSLSVHHVNYRKDSCCTKEVIPLFVPTCSQPCHTKTNGNRKFWQDWFTEIINEFYNGKCYFTEEEMEEYLKNKIAIPINQPLLGVA